MTDEGKEQGIEQRLHKGKSYSFVGTHKYNPLCAVFNEFRLKQCVNSKLLLNDACILCSETVHGYGLFCAARWLPGFESFQNVISITTWRVNSATKTHIHQLKAFN